MPGDYLAEIFSAEGLQEKTRRTNRWSERDVGVHRIIRIRKSFGDLKNKKWWAGGSSVLSNPCLSRVKEFPGKIGRCRAL
jgi:hypothetical protein